MFNERPLFTKADTRSPLHEAGGWFTRHPRLTLGLLLLAALGPFLNKAVHTDDALFVWSAQWIQQHPGDFYGGTVNWWVSDVPMWVANWNPPLLAYLLAGVGTVLGWHEWALHLGGLLMAGLATAGIYALAQRWCQRPLLATVIAIFTPAFLVSASTLMCDVPMLAFWVWAVVLWEKAMAEGMDPRLFLGAGLLAGLAVLTKYSAISLLPLLPLLTLLRTRRSGWWLAGLVVPVVMVGGYEWLTGHQYGQGLLAAASYHARSFRPGFPGGVKATIPIGLAFAGGSTLPVLLMAPCFWRPRALVAGAVVLTGGWLLLFTGWESLGMSENATMLKSAGYLLQVTLLVAGGVHLFLLAAVNAWKRRDPVAIVLLVWTGSVLFFAILVNWLINARSFLPLVPAVAILATRALENAPGRMAGGFCPVAPLLASAVVAVGLVAADCQVANLERETAGKIIVQFKPPGHHLWFCGHGAFQYYMQQQGGLPVDVTRSLLQPGDVLAMPQLGYGLSSLPFGSVGWLGHVSYQPLGWLNLAGATTNGAAGFYGANWGPVPFCLGRAPGQTYYVVKICNGLQMDSQPDNLPRGRVDDVPSIPRISCVVQDPIVFPGKPEAAGELQQAAQCQAEGKVAEAISHYRTALKIDASNVQSLTGLAWLLATTPQPSLRNGAEAVQLASQAVQLSNGRMPMAYGVLAAAYAETGQFAEAINQCRIAATFAHLTGQTAVAQQNADLFNYYAAGKTVAAASQ